MIKPICKDVLFLSRPSTPATAADAQVVQDLLDTLKAHEDGCVGMAANMIGVSKRIIVVSMGPINVAMLNPIITKKKGAYQAQEGCMSLAGVRQATRYKEIEVEFQDVGFKKHSQKYTGFIAQIIQHEVDHLDGILI